MERRRGPAEGDARTGSARRTPINEGDGAFYGPKIDFDVTDAIGRKWQCATIQLDYQLPERFDLHYVGADNAHHRPDRRPSRHFRQFRALSGHDHRALRRRLAAVAGPGAGCRCCRSPTDTWNTPERCRQALAAAGLRVEVDARVEKIGYKIREAQLQKVPYMLVIGDREVAEGAVSVRSRSKGDLGARPLAEFVEAVGRSGEQGARVRLPGLRHRRKVMAATARPIEQNCGGPYRLRSFAPT